jgi:hypothetical protein
MLARKNATTTSSQLEPFALRSSAVSSGARTHVSMVPRVDASPRNIPAKRRHDGESSDRGEKRPTHPRRRLGALGLGLGLLVAPSVASAQTTNESQMWASTTVTAKFGGEEAKDHGPVAWLDLHARRGPDGFLGILRPAIGWRFSPSVALYGGYAWVPFYADDDGTKDVQEHRAWQQLIYQGKEGPFLLQLRPRLEERLRADEDVAFRLRLFGRVNTELWKGAPLAVATWDEGFVQLGETSWGAPGGFDQNRLFLGLAYNVGEVRVEPGYLNVTLRRPDDSLRIEHNFALNTFWSF